MKHLIASAKFNDKAESWLDCTCGERITGPSPEEMNHPFQVHRALNGETYRREGITELKSPKGFEGQLWRTISKNAPRRAKVPA